MLVSQYMIHLVDVLCALEYIICCWVNILQMLYRIKLVKSSIYFFIVLLTYCINGWAWKVKVFNYNCGLSVSPFHSIRFWLLYSEIAYTFLTIMSSQWIEFPVIMYCPLSSVKIFILKYSFMMLIQPLQLSFDLGFGGISISTHLILNY